MKLQEAFATSIVVAARAPDAAMQRGFTIVELMITVLVGGILAIIAVPSLRDTLNNMRQSSALGLLINDMNQARGEAIKRNGTVLICGRNSNGTDCAAITDWRVGWVVCIEGSIVDKCAGAALNPNPNAVIVRPPLDAVLTLTTSVDPIRFRANSGGTAATLTLGGTWSAATRTVAVAATGSISKQ